MRERPPIERPAESRQFVDEALGDLRAGGWRLPAWMAFMERCWARSWEQMRQRPQAAAEVTLLHLALVPLARRSPVTLAISWALAITHLGLLGPQRSLGLPNTLTLIRAQLPAKRWSPPIALATDLADGRLARRRGETAFGGFADPLADAAFWSRLAWARERHPALRWAGVLGWTAPVASLTAAYLVKGRTVDRPRWHWIRGLSVALQCLIAARTIGGLNKE